MIFHLIKLFLIEILIIKFWIMLEIFYTNQCISVKVHKCVICKKCFYLSIPRHSEESSPAGQFENINSLVLSLLNGPTLPSIYDYWKNHRFDYVDPEVYPTIWQFYSRIIFPEEMETGFWRYLSISISIYIYIYTPMFIAVPFTIAKLWEQHK